MKRSPQTFQQNDINKHLCSNVNSTKFFKQDNFCLFINPCSLRDQVIYGSGLRLVNTKDGIQLELNRKTLGSGSLKCHIFIIVITCSIECYSLQPKYMLCSSMDLGNILFNALIVEPTNWGMMQFLVNQNWGSLRTAEIFPVVPPKNNVILRRNDWKYICCLQARTAAPSVASLNMLHSSAQHSLKDLWPLRWQKPAIICEQHRVAFWLKVISLNLWRHQFSYCPWWLCSLERCEKAVREADQAWIFGPPSQPLSAGADPAAFQHCKTFLREYGGNHAVLQAPSQDHESYLWRICQQAFSRWPKATDCKAERALPLWDWIVFKLKERKN